MKHQQHTHLTSQSGGQFHRNEISIIGAPCELIEKFAANLAKELNPYKTAYIDAEHGLTPASSPFFQTYTNKNASHSLVFDNQNIKYAYRSLFNDADLVLINGNHFTGKKQIVIINDQKKESLSQKLDRLTDVILFVLDDGQSDIHEYLQEKWGHVPVLHVHELDKIGDLIIQTLDQNKPVVKGLVLTGGKSSRMGQDKGEISYHGKPQKEYAADLLKKYCVEVLLSKRDTDGSENLPILVDKFLDLGPYGGILTALQSDPNAAWLVVATDIPLLDEKTLDLLVENRDSTKMATCFHNPETNFPEPLITIWEPRAYTRLLTFLAQGFSCPRKALINSDIKEVYLDNNSVLKNANTPDEKETLLKIIHSSH